MSRTIKAMRFLGDLDDDFYSDERRRDVWNEASAVAFQFAYWLTLLTAAVLPWVAGRTGAWVAVGLLVGWVLSSVVLLRYAAAHQVDVYAEMKFVSPRVVLAIGVYLVALIGVVARLAIHPGEGASTWTGMGIGGVLGATAAIIGIRRHQRQHALEEATDEEL